MSDVKLTAEIFVALVDNEANAVTEPLLRRAVTCIAEQDQVIARYKEALEEIRDIARVSDGVEFYAMLADKALPPASY